MAIVGKRKRNNDSDGEDNSSKRKTRTETETETKEPFRPSMIKNKEKRSEIHAKLKHQKKLDKRAKSKARDAAVKRAIELGEEVHTHTLSLSLNRYCCFDCLILIFDFWFLCFVVASGEEGAEDDWEYKRSWWDSLQAWWWRGSIF